VVVLLRRHRCQKFSIHGLRTELGCSTGRSQRGEELCVGRGVVLPLRGDVVFVEDRLNGADRLTCTAVDALVRLDVEHAVALVDAVDGALLDAGLVLQVHTGKGDDVGHRNLHDVPGTGPDGWAPGSPARTTYRPAYC
jgi:hypothetical protein